MIKRTRLAIINAFNRLILQYDFDDITVETIINEAQVSRSTFYRYFNDKYEVMSANIKDIFDKYTDPKNSSGYKDSHIKIFEAIQANLSKYSYLVHPSCIQYFKDFIVSHTYNLILEITKQNRRGEGFTPYEQAQCELFCHALSKMYENIILNKYAITSVESANILFEIAPPSLKYYWWKKHEI